MEEFRFESDGIVVSGSVEPHGLNKILNLSGSLNLHLLPQIELFQKIISFSKEHNIGGLNLSYCNLNGFPDRINEFGGELKVLSLLGNNISVLPESIKELKNLVRLDLSKNLFSSLPNAIGELSLLEHLSLADNPLSSLPGSIGNLKNLSFFDISGTQVEIGGIDKENPFNAQKIVEYLQLSKGSIDSNEIEKCRQAFATFDSDGSGAIDSSEFQTLAFALGEIITEEEAREYVSSIDSDNNGTIEFNEFLAWWARPDRNRRLGVSQDDSALNRLRASLLGQYAANLASSYTDSVTNLAKSVEIPAPSGSVRFGVSIQIGALEHEGSHLNIKLENTQSQDVKAEAHFKLLDSISEEKRNELRQAIESLIQGAPFPVKPQAHVSESGLTLSTALPPKANNLKELFGFLPGASFELDLKLNQEPGASSNIPVEAALTLAVTVDRSIIQLATATGNVPAKMKPALALALVLSNVDLKFQFDSLGEATQNLPASNFAQLKDLSHGSLRPLIQMGMMPPPLVALLRLVKNEKLLGPLDYVLVQVGEYAIRITFSKFDLMELLPEV